MAEPNTKPTIFETFCSTVSMQLEQLHKLDVAESFSAMQEIQTLVNNKIIRLVKSKQNSCSICSLQKPTIINGNPQHIQIIPNNLEHSTDFSNISDDLFIMTPPPTSIEYKYNNINSNSPDKSKFPYICKTSSTESATVTSSPPLISKKFYVEKTPINPTSSTKYLLPPKINSSQSKTHPTNDDDQHTLLLKNSETSIDYLNESGIATIRSSSTSPNLPNFKSYNAIRNYTTAPSRDMFNTKPNKQALNNKNSTLVARYSPNSYKTFSPSTRSSPDFSTFSPMTSRCATITSSSLALNSMYCSKLNVKPQPLKKSFPETKRIKILEDVKLGYTYDSSDLVQIAANDADIIDENYDIISNTSTKFK